jgi:hypothetical protein
MLRSVEDSRQLAADRSLGLRMIGEHGQDRERPRLSGRGIFAAEEGYRDVGGEARVIDEAGCALSWQNGVMLRVPASQDLRQVLDVGLPIGSAVTGNLARAHAERVELQQLAREVLIRRAVRRRIVDIVLIVQVHDQRRLARGSSQQRREGPPQCEADRFGIAVAP